MNGSMSPGAPEHGRSRALRPGAILLLLSGLLLLFGLGDRELWSPDEPRFGMVVREMLRDGHVVVPHLEGKIHVEKPPLYLWLAALASLVGGVSEASLRLPSALAAVGCVLLTFLLGRRLFGERAGWLAAAILLTAAHFLARARWASTDMPLAFFFLWSMVLAASALGVGTGGGVRIAPARWFCVAAGLATLVKGPVGLVLPVVIAAAFLADARRWRDLQRLPWLSGPVLYLLVVVPWYLLFGLQAGWDNLHRILLTENLNRYVQAWNNVQPFYYYLHRFPLSFLPWSLLFPAAAVAIARRWRQESDGGLRFCVLWFAIVFVFFSVSTGKRTVYLLPLFPAVALLLGWFVEGGWRALGEAAPRWMRATALALAALFLLGGIAAPLAAERHREVLPALAGLGLLLAGAGLLLLRQGWSLRLPALTRTVASAVLVAAVVSDRWLVPVMDRFHNIRSLAAGVVRAVPDGGRFATTREKREVLLFYTGLSGGEIRSAADLERFLSSPGPAYCLLPAADLERFVREGAPGGTVILEGNASEHPFVLVSNEAGRAS